ncbi:MAG: hypothetical protein JSR62_03645 [Nitrospira sp.]|nr:hypothetical protein [Nitrospira sp.]
MAITIPTPGEIAAFAQKPQPEVIDSDVTPTKERHELSTEQTPAVTITRYSDGTVRKDWAISQSAVVQPETGLQIQ